MGEFALSKIQYGKETTRGTAVAATRMLLGKAFPVKPDRKPMYPEVNVGIRARSVNEVIYEYLWRDTLKIDQGYFQILPLLFSLGVKGNITPTEQTPSQADYLWTHTPSLTASNAPDAATLEFGDDQQEYEVEHVMAERIKVSGEVNQEGGDAPVAIEAGLFGRQLTGSTFTGALAYPSAEFLNAKLAQIYIDTAWSGVGTTEKTGTLRSFDFEILTGVHPVFTGSGNRYFDTFGESFFDVMANFVLEGNANADAIWDALRAKTFQVVRLKLSGAQIGTGVNHSLTLDVGGTWESVIPLNSESKGNNLHACIFHGRYDATGAKLLQAAISTNQNTV